MVSAGDPHVVSAALAALASGGTVVDAALTASAVASVIEFPWCGVGGDAFLLIHTPADGVVALNGSGSTPLAATAGAFPDGKVPRFGALSVAVPGIAGAWEETARRFASRPLCALLEPAIDLAREGFAVYPRLAHALAQLRRSECSPALADLLAGNGSQVGDGFRLPGLAGTLQQIAEQGAAALRRGPLARAITAALSARGGVLGADDLAEHTTSWARPLAVPYRGRTIYESPPVSLGCVLLQELRIAEGFDLGRYRPGDAALIDLLVRCKLAAFADADPVLGDPAFVDVPIEDLLSDRRAAAWHARIRAELPRGPDATEAGGDTTSLVVADRAGNVAVVIQSLFNEFGSRELVPGTGILLNDRLANLVVDDGQPNGVKPGKRPLHTLNAYIAIDHGEVVLAGATPGGRGQVQTNLQVLVNVFDLGLSLQPAVDAPRWVSGLPYRGPGDRTLYLEDGFASGTAEALDARGHTTVVLTDAEREPFGSCTVISRDRLTGALIGAADHRRGAVAAGF